MAALDPILPGDVDVNTLELTSLSGVNQSIKDQVQELVIYESLFSPFLHGYALIQDAVGLLSEFPLIGEETLSVNYGLNKDKDQRIIKHDFYVFKVDRLEKSDDGKSQAYMLKFVSKEKITDVSEEVITPFNENINSIVERIVKNNLKSSKPVITEPTLGTQQLIFPNISPSTAIDMCTRRAISKSNKSSSFVFYEALNDGFVFKTIEQLIKDAQSGIIDEYFISSERTKEVRENDFYNVVSYNFDARYNTIEKIQKGMVDSELIQYDLVTKKQTSTRFKYKDIFSQTTHVDSRGAGKMNSDDFYSAFESKSRYDATRTNYAYIIDDTSRPDTFLEKSYGFRKGYMTALRQIQGTIAIAGLPNRKVGDVINLKIPPMEGSTDVGSDQDNFVSGNFLVLNIKHNIIGNSKYSMTLDIAKDCYRVPINV